jgi:DNA-binding response OmpR family regulator
MLPKVLLLVVENEAVVRLDLEDTLRDAGFSLVVAVRGDLAIAELEQNAARFGAVLTSIKLGPGPDGWDVARRARELVHGMPVIYMSSSTDGEWTSQGVPRSILIAKPFAAAQVVTAVATLLNQSTP